jgi:membrane protein
MKSRIFQKPKQIVIGTFSNFDQHGGPVMAAGMSFFAMLSLIPLTLLGISALGYIFGSSERAQQFVYQLLSDNFPKRAAEVLEQINSVIAAPERALFNGLGLLGLMWSGLKFFNMLQTVLNKVWVVESKRRFLLGRLGEFLWSRLGSFLWGKLVAFMIFAIAGLLLWISFILDSLVAAASNWNIRFGSIALRDFRLLWVALASLAPIGIWVAMIFLIYVLVPRVRVSLRAALIGAIFSAILIQALRAGFSFVIVRFNMYGNVYGPLATVIVFMSWLYLAMNILLLGAELGAQSQEILFGKEIVAGEIPEQQKTITS